MKKTIKMAIIMTFLGIGVIIGLFVYMAVSNKKPEHKGEDSQLNISQKEAVEIPEDLPLLEDDINLENERGRITVYVDEEDILTPREMMSIRNHILFTEALTNFLNDAGYPADRIIIIPNGAGYEGSVSYFSASVEGYENVILQVESYNTIDSFNFTLLKDNTIIASSREQYKKDTEEYERRLKERYEDITAASEADTTSEEN